MKNKRVIVLGAVVAIGSLWGTACLAQEAPPPETPQTTQPEGAPAPDATPTVTPPQPDAPQATEPQATEPQATEPQVTEPQVTEPEPQAPAVDPVKAMVGAWEFSNADHDKVCRFNFRADAAANGRKVDIDKSCPTVFPLTRDIAIWTVDNYGDLHLLDADGNAVIDFSEVESGMYDGFKPDQGRFVLQSVAAVVVATPVRPEDLVGDWAVSRGAGKPICTLTLAKTAAGAPDAFALKVKSGCDALVTRFGPTSWRLDQDELVLLAARGQSWRFEKNDANSWQRVPETPDSILLVRQ